MPFPFLPNAKPRNLKFRIANTLTVRLFSRLTVSFSLFSRYFVLLSKSLSDARPLFARSTMSSAYLMHGTPLFRNSWSNSLRYTFAVVLDLSKYFDTLNHEILINLLRKNVKDERVVQLIKRYLKSGVMENGVVIDTEEGSPQGGLCRARHKFPYDEINVMTR